MNIWKHLQTPLQTGTAVRFQTGPVCLIKRSL